MALASLATAPLLGAACGGSNAASGGGDGGLTAETGAADAGADALTFFEDAAIGPRCTEANLQDPVALCVQRLAILGEHNEFSSITGLPSAWSVDTLLPETTDGGTVIHDVTDDVAYGASLADYYVSATTYGDPYGLPTVTLDMDEVAQILEQELLTMPADYDGQLYLRLRRLAGGLRLASFATDADAIDALATKYGAAIYTSYFHALSPTTVTPDAGPDGSASTEDGGSEDGGALEDASSTSDAAIGATDAGGDAGASVDAGTVTTLQGDGILGTPAAGGGYAYDVQKAASGALALVDLAARANGFSLTPDGGVDAAAPVPTNAVAWLQAANAVFNHLGLRAHDATSGLYFNALQTSSDVGHDTVTDDGSFTSQTQGSVATSYLRAARLVTTAHLGSTLPASSLTSAALATLNATQSSAVPLWDLRFGNLTLAACSAATPPDTVCGSGFFAGLDPTQTIVDKRKSISGNALLLDALHRASVATSITAAETDDLPPLFALFAFANNVQFSEDAGTLDSFFTQVIGQVAYVDYVTETFALTETEDGGLPETIDDAGLIPGALATPLARFYTAAATADAIEGMNDQWIGVTGAPAFFQ